MRSVSERSWSRIWKLKRQSIGFSIPATNHGAFFFQSQSWWALKITEKTRISKLKFLLFHTQSLGLLRSGIETWKHLDRKFTPARKNTLLSAISRKRRLFWSWFIFPAANGSSDPAKGGLQQWSGTQELLLFFTHSKNQPRPLQERWNSFFLFLLSGTENEKTCTLLLC